MAATTPPKPWFESKTLWVNALTGIITLVTSLSGTLPPEGGKYVAMFLVVANVVLRLLTSAALTGG